jgi:hypothetical protein
MKMGKKVDIGMAEKTQRLTVDLSHFPDLVVIYLGMRAHSVRGLRTLRFFGKEIAKSIAAKPDGLLMHENLSYSLLPPHLRMRQYWRNFDSLEAWTRQQPHQRWWKTFLSDPAGTGFWHETYFMGGGMEAIYDARLPKVGMMNFAPLIQAHGSMFSARRRLQLADEVPPAPLSEQELAPTPAPRSTDDMS